MPMMSPAVLLDEQAALLQRHLRRFDVRSRWFGLGRSLICFAELTVVLLTPAKALLIPVLTITDGARCDGVRAGSAFCLVGEDHGEWARWLLVAVLLVAASGYRPRWTAVPQLWAVYSIAVSISVPDGGESVSLIMSMLMVPISLADGRTWHWTRDAGAGPDGPAADPVGPTARAVAFAAFCAIRIQLAYIYLDTAISKFGVADWANGTAEYYFLRDKMFGVGTPWDGLLLAVSKNSLIVVAMTWGALVVELVIAGCILGSHRWRKVGLVLDVLLHGTIILTMGLWSFGLVMIGCAVLISMPPLAVPAEDAPGPAPLADLPAAGARRPAGVGAV
ncbi:sporulation-delaying protein SdpB family protein [Kitasatospora sp. NPDC094015]|uniref:sporulation-delaying protein SdpB family protein n=1 Tax=Kitasatospora sp. NPDC094015 TaxID=3155205 RepID=UPI00332E4F38